MKRLLTLAVAVAAVFATLSAHATFLDAKFFGSVQSQTGTSFAVNSPISGEFLYDTVAGKYLSFTIGGYSVAPGYASSAAITPDQYSAIYQAQVSPVTGGTINSTFTVDLEGLNKWTYFGDAVPLLTDSPQLANNLDTSLSNFGFYTANADGTNIQQLTASLTSFAVTVPEPGSLPLVMIAFAAMVVASRRAHIR